MVKTDTESEAEIGLSVENHQGVRSHREWEKCGLSHLSVLQNACSPQMFASNINNMPNKPLCSSLQLQLPLHNAEWEVCVCQFFRNQSQTALRSQGWAETHQINHNELMDELMDSS